MELIEITEFYHILEEGPASARFQDLKVRIAGNSELKDNWHEFLVEQQHGGDLPQEWVGYMQRIPDLAVMQKRQQEVIDGIRAIQNDQIRNELRAIFRDRFAAPPGHRRRWYGAGRAAAVLLLLCAGLVLIQKRMHTIDPARPLAHIRTLVVEPFVLQGVTEEMISQGFSQRIPAKLSSAGGIYPVTSFAVRHVRFRSEDGYPASFLNAAYAVRGSIRRNGELLEVHARLVRIQGDQELWNAVYTVRDDPRSLNELHDKVSLGIAKVLHPSLPRNTKERICVDVSDNAEALAYFLKGERSYAERTRESVASAISSFGRAVELDPRSAVSRGYLALAYDTYAENEWGGQTDWVNALTEAKKTLAVDPDNAEALLVLGDHAEMVEKDYVKAAEYFQLALRTQPGDAKIHQAIAELHLRTGEINTGLEYMHMARLLEPEHRVVRWVETKYLTASGRLEDAKDAADDLMRMYPDFPYIRNFYWQYYLSKGAYQEALDAIPDNAEQWRRNYMYGMVYLEKKDFDALHALYPDESIMPETFILLEMVQKDEWQSVYKLLREMLDQGRCEFLALFQTSDFSIFNKMKVDPGVRELFAMKGIEVHFIPARVQEI